MITYPNCKINLGLRIIGKRPDGYHNLETIFYPVYGLHDTLEIKRQDHFQFIQTGHIVTGAEEDNLVVRCYRLMQELYPQIGSVCIRLHKNIPFGAGLGGGSSDAAHTAIMLNEIFQLGLNRQQLMDIVTPLGADCPFFIQNQPCYAGGIGDELQPIPALLDNLRIVILKPETGISTREAYAGIHLHPEAEGNLLQALRQGEKALLKAAINDFEETVFPLHIELNTIKQMLLQAGAKYAAMSGSGSAIYGLFEDDSEGRTNPNLRMFNKDFAPMVIFNDTLGKREP